MKTMKAGRIYEMNKWVKELCIICLLTLMCNVPDGGCATRTATGLMNVSWDTFSWGCGSSCFPGVGDKAIIPTGETRHMQYVNVSVDQVSLTGGTLDVRAKILTLSNSTPFDVVTGTLIATSGTVRLADNNITLLGSFTYLNLVMPTVTGNRTITLGSSGNGAAITVTGNFISGTSATNTVSFAKGDPTSNVLNQVNSYYCASNGGITNITCFPGGPPPTAPSNLTTGTITQNSVVLNWNDNSSDETGFKVYDGATLLTTTLADVETYTVSGLSCGTNHTFTVVATNGADSAAAATTPNATTTTSACDAVVSISSVSNVKATTALATGTASGTGIGERGFFWWNDETYWGPRASGLIPAGYGAGDFSLTLTGLPIKTRLYVSAYIKVGGQLITSGAGNFITITTTDPMIPTVITKPDFTVNGNELLAKGEITDVGSSPVRIYGFVYAKHTSPTVWDMALPFTWDMTLPISAGKAFEGTIRNLTAGTYYFRAYAHNSQGTAYGGEFSFTITGSSDCGGGVPGDLNGDGNVDLTDAIIALKILDGVPVSGLNLKADVNGDCKIGLEEAIFVLQKVGLLR